MSEISENAALYFVDRHAAGDHRDKIAFLEADGEKRSLTYEALSRRQRARSRISSSVTASITRTASRC